MIILKRYYQSFGKFTVILYLLLFPLGQLLRFGFDKNYGNLQDLVVLFSVLLYFYPNTTLPRIDKQIRFFIYIAVFSLFLSLTYLEPSQVGYGALYLIRIVSYYTFGVMVFNLVKLKTFNYDNLLKLLVLTTLAAAVLGWIQYLWIPNLIYLKYLNWDDHLNRLTGTYLDPGFTGIIFSFGTLVSIYLYLKSKANWLILVAIFLIISVLLTYSRASYLALAFGLIIYTIREKINIKLILSILVIGLLSIIMWLPRLPGEGTNLLRTQSVIARAVNYSQTIQIIKKNPVFGVGLNNLCSIRIKMFNEKQVSHSCSGVDSSILFILATTGIVGLTIFVNAVISAISFSNQTQRYLLFPIILAILVHSLFVQSMFYSFSMGYLAIVFGSVGNTKG